MYFGIYGETYWIGLFIFLFVLVLGALILGIILLFTFIPHIGDIIFDVLITQIPKHQKSWIGFSLIVTIIYVGLSLIWLINMHQASSEIAVKFIKISAGYWITCFLAMVGGWSLFFLAHINELVNKVVGLRNDVKDAEARTEEAKSETESVLARALDAEAKIVQWEKQFAKTNDNSEYVHSSRIAELRAISSEQFDLTRLIELCEELNDNHTKGNVLAVPMLVRAMLDHVPPILGYNSFIEVTNNYGGSQAFKSFKKSIQNLQNSLRNIADANIHSAIRSKETLPNSTQIDFSPDLDVLLAEIVRILK